MERGSLSSKYDDRTPPLGKHAEAMIEKGGFAPAPMAAQFFGNAGKEHMEKFGTQQHHFTKIAAKNKVQIFHFPSYDMFTKQIYVKILKTKILCI